YEWDLNNDGTYDATGENIDYTWTSPGPYLVQLRITDDESQTDILDTPLSVEITSRNPIAVAEADPNPQIVNLPVSFSGSGSNDPDGGTIQLFEWDWDNDGTYDETGENVDHTWTSPGTYLVQLRVTDDESETDTLDEPVEIVIFSTSGILMWAKRAGGSTTDKVYGITTLSDNSTVVTGWFTGSATFGPGDPNQTILTAADGYDIFIARYKQDGTLAWAKRVGEPNQTILNAAGYDIFVARYNPDGTLAWAKRAGGGSYYSLGIAPLADDSAVITGGFSGSSTFGPGEAHQTVLTATSGGTDIFVARYNSDGTLAWAKRAGGSYYQDLSYEVTALADNSTVVTGAYGISATFGQGEPNATVLTSIGGTDIFIAQYNANGTLAWAKSAGGPLNDYGSAITTLSDSTTVVTGWYAGSAVFGMGEPNQTTLNAVGGFNIFVAHYNLDGTLAWVKGAEGSFVNEWGNGITTLSDDSTVVTGGYNISATFGPGDPNQTVLNSAGGYDIFIARYNTDGTIGWAKSAGGLYLDEGSGITALSDDSTVITGVFEGSSTFGLGESAQTIVTSVGESDIFIARYNP
ncbi:MAG: PKD domain-containing protein, partial [bacterium]|nr:PKD domain-containing protein [bacterium]